MVYDIVIIGAGPAGSTFAREVAKSGLSIMLIDGQDETNKKPCGGLLSPDAQKALAYFDLSLPKEVLVDPQIFSVKTIDVCSKRIRKYQRCYLNMDRYAFDKWLVSLVPESIEICNGKCLDIVEENGIFNLTLKIDGEKKKVQAKYLVGADGAKSMVRKKFFKQKVMRYTAIQQWFEMSDNVMPFYSCIFDEKTSPSCSWSICKDDYFIYGGCFEHTDSRKAYDEQKKRVMQFADFKMDKCIKTEACMALRPRKYSDFQTGKNGVFLIGEAAGYISPSSFEGISNAIVSGNELAKAFLNKDSFKSIHKVYRRGTRKLRRKLVKKMIKRWFMYTPFARNIVMSTGLKSIE